MRQLILLDRDGVINQDSLHYIKSVDEFIFIPDSVAAIAQLSRAGYTIGVATNQSGVSRGLYTEDDLAMIHQKMTQAVLAAGGKVDAIEYCVHLPSQQCFCRKPNPGMLLSLAKKFGCSLAGVPFIGDRISDIQAAYAAGATPVMVLSSMTDLDGLSAYPEVPVFHSLAEYVAQLLATP
ncbi:D-glycero-beta-D-manno-heptose 1,7-bisphosphate 7-phosphatase [Legionella worsleiensis]|uniref:D,D-heptose 1,7-bisphosphate phosphatase n=1 Tax=Legionella worsleiensis TaxID=45076 RepID=A0A0W1AIP6_9GAMM|nr:D-glycero-beta-D-manno-heptose 1,7-bisphosphate 7-phosphatase [Legionella worsleiensis]KTD81186.1 D,D-heptose 1,7-bisphosphate phosphatase [Legionella worsleiensis]STY33162.1 D,D-heptose 1,7-bisphosphate phosphatase [Legionella worsleiensis]